MLEYLLFAFGFVFLVKGAGFLVDGASSIAKRFGVAPVVIGLTLVAFGTSFPELVVNIFASGESSDIALGNILGSNISNILLILGLCALIVPIKIPKNTIWKEIPFSLIAVVVLAIIVNDMLFVGSPSFLSRGDGLILLIFFLIFLYYVSILIRYYHPRKTRKEIEKLRFDKYVLNKARKTVEGLDKVVLDTIQFKPLEKQIQIKTRPFPVSIVMILLGLAGLVIGGQWVVDGAVFIARSFGLSEALIGLTIIAIGTSLPELVTSLVAIKKKNFDISVGNIVGSNIFNVFFILAISSLIRPLSFSYMLNFDLVVVLASSFLLFLFMFIGKKHTLDRWQGLVFVLFYIAYLVFLVYRG